jgi:ABC-type amino acid transport substrate-binding protein
VARVCYRGGDYPSAFFNNAGDLVGFDIEMAHRFARQLGARIVDGLYRDWMLGEIDATRPPRWSIARDVLGWLD